MIRSGNVAADPKPALDDLVATLTFRGVMHACLGRVLTCDMGCQQGLKIRWWNGRMGVAPRCEKGNPVRPREEIFLQQLDSRVHFWDRTPGHAASRRAGERSRERNVLRLSTCRFWAQFRTPQ